MKKMVSMILAILMMAVALFPASSLAETNSANTTILLSFDELNEACSNELHFIGGILYGMGFKALEKDDTFLPLFVEAEEEKTYNPAKQVLYSESPLTMKNLVTISNAYGGELILVFEGKFFTILQVGKVVIMAPSADYHMEWGNHSFNDHMVQYLMGANSISF